MQLFKINAENFLLYLTSNEEPLKCFRQWEASEILSAKIEINHASFHLYISHTNIPYCIYDTYNEGGDRG